MKKPSGKRAWKALLLSCSFSAKCLSKGIGLLKSQLFYLQELESMEHFKLMLMEYLVYYNIIPSVDKDTQGFRSQTARHNCVVLI